MARYRQIHTKIWKDGWFLDLEPKHKLFFIYLFSNERASIAGIYELPIAVMAFESGLSREEIWEAFDVFSHDGKAYYEDDVVWVTKLRDYHETSSAQVQKGIQNEIDDVPECDLKRRYLVHYGHAVEAEEPEPEPTGDDIGAGEPSNIPFEGNGRAGEGMERVSRPSNMSMSQSISRSTGDRGVGKGGEPAASDQEILDFLDSNGIPKPETDGEWQAVRHPAIWDWIAATNEWPGYDKMPHIIRRLGRDVDTEALSRAWDDWLASGYKRTNVRGVIDFYEERLQPEDNGAGGGHGAAEKAWSVVQEALNQGTAQPIMERDDVLTAVNACGRWPSFAECDSRFLDQKKRQFVEAYNAQR